MKKQGFTLIELLAVIVILAIIALIATPMILGVIEKARKGAAESSALGYIDAVEKYAVFGMMDGGNLSLTDGVYDLPLTGVQIKGEAPTKGWVEVTKGEVTNYSIVVSGYTVTKGAKTEKGDAVANKPSGEVITTLPLGLTKGTAVYVNPETKAVCSEADAVSKIGTKTGCMKWYVYKDNGDSTYQLLLDHNTTATVAWNSSNNNAGGMKEVAESLTNDTASWNSSLSPRLITADEVAEITGANKDPYNFSGATATYDKFFYLDTNIGTASTTCKSGDITGCQYGWLYDRTYGCSAYGCPNKADNADSAMTGFGYWTSTPVSGRTEFAWCVFRHGSFNRNEQGVSDVTLAGVRPVITF